MERHDDDRISSFLERLRQRIESLLPPEGVNRVLEQVRDMLRQGFPELDLVPRRELDGHLATLEQLTKTIKDLERRIAVLEADQ